MNSTNTLEPSTVNQWVRHLVWRGTVTTVTCGAVGYAHVFAWSGAIPCTGFRRCIYCGKPKHEHIGAAELRA